MEPAGVKRVERHALFQQLYSAPSLSVKGHVPEIFNSFNGGLLMTVADPAAAFALMTITGPQTETATTDMNIRFLASCLSDLTVRAKVIKSGRSLSPISVDLFGENETNVAIAQVNYMVFRQ